MLLAKQLGATPAKAQYLRPEIQRASKQVASHVGESQDHVLRAAASAAKVYNHARHSVGKLGIKRGACTSGRGERVSV